MRERSAEEAAAIRYLLGDMGEEEKIALEKSLIESEDAFEQVAAVEDELIDDYLIGALVEEERDRFEKSYLSSPVRRERVEFARALQQRLSEKPRSGRVIAFSAGSHRPAARLLAAAAVLFAALGAYFAWTSIQLREELRRVESEKGVIVRREEDLARQFDHVRSRADHLQTELEQQRSKATGLSEQLANVESRVANSISFVLRSGLFRDRGALPTLRLPRGAETVRLSLSVPAASYASYRVTIQTPEGKEVWKGEATPSQPGAKTLVVTVPARVLSSGDYIVSVTGVTASGTQEPAADYSFRVKKR